jgi:hypothetical protein
MFKTFAQKGFQTTFKNGFTVSVMFGAGNYCENRFSDLEVGDTVKAWSNHNSPDAEIAVIGPDCDQVRGWVTTEEMLEVMNWAASQ